MACIHSSPDLSAEVAGSNQCKGLGLGTAFHVSGTVFLPDYLRLHDIATFDELSRPYPTVISIVHTNRLVVLTAEWLPWLHDLLGTICISLTTSFLVVSFSLE